MKPKKKEDEKKEIARLGLIYDVRRQRFNIVYKDLLTNQIRVGPYYGKEAQEVDSSKKLTI